jgi:quercetin dioxygenase-like cupin family protein
MPVHLKTPTRIPAAGNKPKLIDEYVGHLNSGTAALSIARMRSPAGWVEPAQRPDFDEYTLVLRGLLRVEHDGGTIDVREGEAIAVRAGERVRYSTPDADGAEYLAVCLPAFSPQSVHREG